jgi:uncharacterized membrane protein YqjE
VLIQGKRAAGRTEGPAGFFDLVERLFADMGALLDQKLTLLAIELKHEGAVVVRNLLILLVGVVCATLGLLLLGMAAALWIGTVIGSVPGGYGIMGGVFVLGGGGLLAAVRGRLEQQQLLPRKTVQELRRDANWIKSEL